MSESSQPHARYRGRRLLVVGLLALLLLTVLGYRYWSTRPQQRFQQALQAIQQEQWATAEQLASQLETQGWTDQANRLRGEAFLLQGRAYDAIRYLQKIPDTSPEIDTANLLQGRAWLGLKQWDQAFVYYQQVLAKNPDSVEAHRGLAVVAYDLGQLSLAMDHARRVSELDLQDGKPLRLMGLIDKDLSYFETAEASYREALKRELPESLRQEAQLELAEVLIERTKFSEALDVLAERGKSSPETEASQIARIEAHRGLGQDQQASELLAKALPTYPKSAKLQRLRGHLALDRQQFTEAASALEEATRLAPGDDVAQYLLSQAYTALGRKADAEATLKTVERLRADLQKMTDLSREAMVKPWDRQVRLKLAEICDRISRPELAKMWREAAEHCPPASP